MYILKLNEKFYIKCTDWIGLDYTSDINQADFLTIEQVNEIIELCRNEGCLKVNGVKFKDASLLEFEITGKNEKNCLFRK